jgi:hypothetical protein
MEEMSVRAFVARIDAARATDEFYAVSRNKNGRRAGLRALFDDIAIPADYRFSGTLGAGAELWMGPAGTITPLHHDTSNILFVQVHGRKRVQLVPPAELSVLDFVDGHFVPESRLDDLLGTEIAVREVELGPGETLHIPVGWWHRVVALAPSISLSINGFVGNDLDWYRPGRVR